MEGALSRLARFLRYRFLLFAGLLPYCLGAAIGSASRGTADLFFFLVGLAGLAFALTGVEAFNEFFDWRIGADRVFALDRRPVTIRTLIAGLIAFSLAFSVAIYLTIRLGVPVIVLTVMGFLGALFYLAPPVKLAYRGFGEITIAVCYGPLMSLGGYYLQMRQIDGEPLFSSMIPALLLFAIAVMNEVPDYYQDKLVGKRNLCVRMGRRNAVNVCGLAEILCCVSLACGLAAGEVPPLGWVALIGLPLSAWSYRVAARSWDDPRRFLPAIRGLLIVYVIVLGALILAYAANGLGSGARGRRGERKPSGRQATFALESTDGSEEPAGIHPKPRVYFSGLLRRSYLFSTL